MRSTRLIAVTIAICAAAATPAMAADPAQDGYRTIPIEVPPLKGSATTLGVTTTEDPPIASVTPPEKTGGSLPFTGLDAGLMLGAAFLLLGLGFTIRRSVNGH